MIAALPPPPCVASIDALCVVAPYGDTLVAQRGIPAPPFDAASQARADQKVARHKAAVRSLGAEILDDDGDAMMVEVPKPNEAQLCQASLCIRYSVSCDGASTAVNCSVVLHLPYEGGRGNKTMLRREVAIRAQSASTLASAVAATYVVVGQPNVAFISMTKLIPPNDKVAP